MSEIAQILDFSLSFADALLQSGASLERVNDSIRRICYSYEVEDLSLYSMSTVMFISARDRDGTVINRQRNMHGSDIQLTRLVRLNDLSRRICGDHPDADDLQELLAEAVTVPEYPMPLVMAGQLTALACLARIFGGNVKDVLVMLVITAVMFLMGIYVKKPWLNAIVYNAVTAGVAGILSYLAVWLHLADHVYVLMITSSMMLIPGVPLVNATSNLFCGNEMNGLMELLKVVVETLAIVGGLVAAGYLMGGLIA